MSRAPRAGMARGTVVLGLGYAVLASSIFTVLLDFLVGHGKGVMLPLMVF